MFFPSWKTVFKQSRQLLNTSSTPGYLSSFSTSFYHNPDSFLAAGGTINKVFDPLIAFRQLMDRSSFSIIFYVELFLDRSSKAAFVEAFYAWHLSRHLSTPLFVEIYWTPIYSFTAIRLSFCSTSLSIYPSFHLPNLSHSLQTSSSRFLQAFSRFSSLGKLLISHIHAFHVLKPRIWGFWKILGFFKIVEFLLKFWDGFLFEWSLNLMHCIT